MDEYRRYCQNFFIPETLLELKEFLSIFKNRKEKIFVIGAGSNLLVGEDIDKYAFVKLGKNLIKFQFQMTIL